MPGEHEPTGDTGGEGFPSPLGAESILHEGAEQTKSPDVNTEVQQPNTDQARVEQALADAATPLDSAIEGVKDNPASTGVVEVLERTKQDQAEAIRAAYESFFTHRDQLYQAQAGATAQFIAGYTEDRVVLLDSARLAKLKASSEVKADIAGLEKQFNVITPVDELAIIQHTLDSLGVTYDVNSLFLYEAVTSIDELKYRNEMKDQVLESPLGVNVRITRREGSSLKNHYERTNDRNFGGTPQFRNNRQDEGHMRDLGKGEITDRQRDSDLEDHDVKFTIKLEKKTK